MSNGIGDIDACDEIADGSHLEQFPTALLLGGGGTTTNMNLNEVIANRASQIGQIAVHPNDHANASQSTNDTFPTAMALTLMDLAQAPLAALHELTKSLCAKAQEYADRPISAGPVCKMQLPFTRVKLCGARHGRYAGPQNNCGMPSATWPRCHLGQPWWVPE